MPNVVKGSWFVRSGVGRRFGRRESGKSNYDSLLPISPLPNKKSCEVITRIPYNAAGKALSSGEETDG